jgi:hypothetical protein
VFVPDFDISISTYSLTVDQGKSATVTVTVEQVNGYSYDVSLSASGQPSGVTITYSPDHETPTFTSNMTIQVAYDVPANTYPIIVGGAGSDPESKTHERTFSLTVNKITFMTDSRLEVVPSSSYNTEILGVSVSFNMCSITPSTSNEDYRSAVYQHFGIILSGDAQHESMTMLEIHGLCDLADYLSQQWWSSWAFTSDFVSYIFGQHDTDGVARLAIVFRYSIDAEWITRSSIATLNLVKLLHGADDYSVDNLKNLLHEIANVFASTLELSFYHVFLTSPQDTKVIRSLSTSVIAQWAQEVNDFLDHAEPYTLILKIGLKLCKILLNIKDPVSLSFFIVTTAFEIADCLITLYFHDYFPETIVTIVHILASWDDPPELTADTQVFSESGDLVLGWNSTGGDFIDYSSAGFVMRDSNTQILFLKKIAPTTVGITAHGSSLDYIPYTLCIVDDYGNKSYVSSGLLSTNQSVNIGIDFVGNITEFGNHLIVEMNISTTTPIRGQLLTINIAVNDTAEPRADATVTLLINNATWVTADNLGYGQYQTIVDTSSMVGLIPIIVYADYSNMTTGYDAVILNVLSSPVGGIYVPVNKLQLLAPYIGLTTLLAVAVMTVAYVKKRKRNTEITS